MLARRPKEVLRKAIVGMLGRHTLRYAYIEKRLRLYEGPNHNHTAQLGENAKSGINDVPRSLKGGYFFGFKDKPYHGTA